MENCTFPLDSGKGVPFENCTVPMDYCKAVPFEYCTVSMDFCKGLPFQNDIHNVVHIDSSKGIIISELYSS
jgi:hypothetical protein